MLAKTIIFLIFILNGFNSQAQNSETQKERQTKNQLAIGIIGPQIKLDPLLGYYYMDFLAIQCLYQTLVRFSADHEIIGNLIDSWEISNDRKTYKFHINEKSIFGNGTKVTSSDVIFSLTRHGWPSSKSIIKGYLNDHISGYKNLGENMTPSGLKKINDSSFEITLNQPYAPFLYLLAMPGFSIVPKKDSDRLKLIGSGPFAVEKIDDRFIFKANPLYKASSPLVNKLSIVTFSNAKNAKDALVEKQIDVLLNLPYTQENIRTLPSGYQFKPTESLAYQHFFVNSKKNIPLDIRKNIGQFIQHISTNFTQEKDFFYPIRTFIPSGVLPQHYQDRIIDPYEEKAFLKKISNLGEKIRIMITKERTSETFVQSLKTNLQKMTNKILVEEVDLQSFRDRLSSGDYEFALFAYIGNYPDPDGFLDSIRDNNFPGVNVDSKSLFANIDQIRHESEPTERVRKYAQAIRQFEDQWTVLPLYQMKLPYVVANNINIKKTKYRYESEFWNFLWEKQE